MAPGAEKLVISPATATIKTRSYKPVRIAAAKLVPGVLELGELTTLNRPATTFRPPEKNLLVACWTVIEVLVA